MFGLSNRTLKIIRDSISTVKQIETVKIYGSRVLGTYKKGSDIDFAIQGRNLTYNDILRLNDLLNEQSPLPYQFDLTDYGKITNEDLKNHIDLNGKILYQRQS